MTADERINEDRDKVTKMPSVSNDVCRVTN